jgi:superfamily II DNA/RNA helicase
MNERYSTVQKTNFKSGRRYGYNNHNSGRPAQSRNSGRNNRGGGRRPNRANDRKYIDPSRFINHAVAPEEEIQYVPTNSFTDFNFDKQVADNLAKIGYAQPTAIQDQAIPLVMEGNDLLGLANTGTGKTAAFLLPIINKLMQNPAQNSVLIIAPTRELAIQIDDEFKKFAIGMRLYSAVAVGGANIGRQITQLKRHPNVIVGTPGRLGDLIKRKVVRLDSIQTFVLDEVDRMLDMGFVDEIRRIAAQIPPARQTLTFSATMAPNIKAILDDLLKPDYKTVSVATRQTNEHIDQDVIVAFDKTEKIKLLKQLLNEPEVEKVLIFGETKHGVQRLADNLTDANFLATAIHGDKSQQQRQRALKSFKENQVNIMVATDVAARGLDIPNVSHVINFDLPQTYGDYVHRIGRTGRAGKTGKALTFVQK